MQITVRKAKLKDVKLIAELHKKVVNEINAKFYSTEAIKEWIEDISEENVKHQFQNSDWIVASVNDKLVGFGQYSIVDGETDQINVSPDFLSQNIGKKLYNYMENDFRNNGVEKIRLKSTLNAVGFYEKLGFKVVQEVYVGLVKTMGMEKFLQIQK